MKHLAKTLLCLSILNYCYAEVSKAEILAEPIPYHEAANLGKCKVSSKVKRVKNKVIEMFTNDNRVGFHLCLSSTQKKRVSSFFSDAKVGSINENSMLILSNNKFDDFISAHRDSLIYSDGLSIVFSLRDDYATFMTYSGVHGSLIITPINDNRDFIGPSYIIYHDEDSDRIINGEIYGRKLLSFESLNY
ncbi:hypothetical protein [Halobacteriovorax sp.]|uniref:hypothetical protein n=1 Tax=Halobacteriovorax sp. TaxID=2020862 RepID=UPI003AF2F5F2